tara:strand:- start:20032 stop:20145 length:114 start_codon:yes stop_codon:yes gene_type:complete
MFKKAKTTGAMFEVPSRVLEKERDETAQRKKMTSQAQ